MGRAWVVTGDDPRPLAELVEGILAAAGLATPSARFRTRRRGSPVGSLGRLWPGDEPPLTYFAARQLSVAHWFDQREVQSVLEWTPKVSVNEGLARLAQWFEESRAGSSARTI